VNSEELIISIVRIVGSVPVLFFPFWGSILAILIDLSDLFMMGYINMGGVSNYQQLQILGFVLYEFILNGIFKMELKGKIGFY